LKLRFILPITFFIIIWAAADSARSQTAGIPLRAEMHNSCKRQELFLTISTIRARPQAMGGAFTAIRDGISSAVYNPAGLQLHKIPKQPRFSFFLNPIGSAVGLRDPHSLKSDSTWRTPDAIAAAGLFIKSIALSWSAFEAVLVLTEMLPSPSYESKNRQFFYSENILDRYSNILATRLQLAEQISIGTSVTFYNFDENHEKRILYGSCYGILVQPNKKVNIGLAYFDTPARVAPIRTKLDRFVDETINLGISWRPLQATLLSLDIRNVSEEQKTITREIHLGTELIPFQHLAIRSGYYRKPLDKENVFSVGIGLLSTNFLRKSRGSPDNPNWIFNYAFVYDDHAGNYEIWHYLSFLLRI
jgi:hypothetical protein